MTAPDPARAPAPDDVVLDAPPALGPLYARALARAARGQAGHRSGELTSRALVVPAVTVEAAALAAHARVCGGAFTGVAPLAYPHLLAFGAQVRLMLTEPFPFGVLGLVHLRQVVTQHRPLRAGEQVRVRVSAAGLAAHPRGAVVDLLADLDVDGEPVWSGRSTYLSRGAPVQGLPAAPDAGPAPVLTGPASARWRVPADTGRRYARLSGDVNPIHLHPLTARALGFPRAIAHGMWTLARATAAVAPRLPGAVTADVRFARPVLLPSTAELLVRPAGGTAGAQGWDLALRSGTGEGARTHLSGSLRPLG